MKKIIVILISSIFLLTGCKKANDLSKFDINYSTQINVPVTAGLGTPFNVFTPMINSDYESKFNINSTDSERVESIFLKSLKLDLVSPADSNLGFIESVELFIKADGINEEKIAWKMDVSNSVGTTLSLDVSESNIKPYITSEKFQIRVRTIIDEVITEDHKIDMDATFEVDALLFGS